LLPATFLLFTLAYSGNEKLLRKYILIMPFAIGINLLLYLVWATDYIFVRQLQSDYGFLAGQYYYLLCLWILALFILSILILSSTYTKSINQLQKKQVKIIIVGSLFTLFGYVVTLFVLPLLNQKSDAIQIISDTILYIIVGYALLKYKLFTFDEGAVTRDLFYTFHSAFILVDENKKIILTNQFFEKITGYSSKELTGRNLDTIFLDAETYNDFENKVINTASTPNVVDSEETVFVSKSGQNIAVSVYAVEYLDTHQNPVGTILIANDIKKIKEKSKGLEIKSEQILNQNIELEKTKKAILNILEDLTQSKTRIEEEKIKAEAMLESIGDGMITTDKDGYIILVNQAATQMLHQTPKDLLGKEYASALTLIDKYGKDVLQDERPMNKSLKSMTKVNTSDLGFEYSYRRKDGTVFPVALTVTPVIHKEHLLGAISIFRDVTREKDVDRMKTEFISLASHQLRTPLSALKWYSEMLLVGDVGKLNDEQQKFVTNINLSTERMIALVNSLLNISRIESGRIIIDPVRTNILELVNDVIEELKIKYHGKNQLVKVSSDKNLTLADLDPKLVRQVFLNLLSNSMKYTQDQGEISINISTTDKEIITEIRDNGFGIPIEQQGNIFKKFFRAENV
jgi:PAS domain S-box-containing protein